MPPNPNLRIVSFGTNSPAGRCELLNIGTTDGGGVRGLSQLEVMRNVMHRLNWDNEAEVSAEGILPCSRFDLMGGSGTGG
jgi:patatin-like phospholipase/acyl hydrolase